MLEKFSRIEDLVLDCRNISAEIVKNAQLILLRVTLLDKSDKILIYF